MRDIRFVPLFPDKADDLWQRILVGIDPCRAYGPEYPKHRPDGDEEVFATLGNNALIGMWGFKLPSHTTANAWTGFLPAHRGQGWNQVFQRARCQYLFDVRGYKRVGYGVYTSNEHSLHVSSKSELFTVEGCLKDFIEVDGQMYDCIKFGITLPEWRQKK
jgi:RimJ/RimL family protein N-acetyltransferase